MFRHIQCLHLINSEAALVLVSSGTQVQPQIMLDPDYLLDYLSVSYDYGNNSSFKRSAYFNMIFAGYFERF